MAAKVLMDGQWVEVVTLADLGCSSMEDLRKLCETSSGETPAWAKVGKPNVPR